MVCQLCGHETLLVPYCVTCIPIAREAVIMSNEIPQVTDKRRFTHLEFAEPVRCLRCGHERRFSDNEGGTCEKFVPPFDGPRDNLCGCLCEFPPEPHVATFSPASALSPTPGMDFGSALKQVLRGQPVTRLEWENPEIRLLLFRCRVPNFGVEDGNYLSIRRADGTVGPLFVSDADLRADDWVVVV